MREYQSLSHVRWECKYHRVFVPKYRKKVLYGRTRQRIGRIFHQLCRQKEVGLIEGHAMPDHVHMVLSIPPKYSVSSVLGYLKGKSAIMIHREMERVKHGFTGKHFWAQGYFASTVGLDEEMIREYVRHQEESDDEGQSGLFPKIAPSRGFPSSHVLWVWFVTF